LEGDGGFVPMMTVIVGMQPEGADLDGDGSADFVVASA
jgi:hypothetical protein